MMRRSRRKKPRRGRRGGGADSHLAVLPWGIVLSARFSTSPRAEETFFSRLGEQAGTYTRKRYRSGAATA